MLEGLGRSGAPEEDQQKFEGAGGRNNTSNDQMSLNTWRENLLEEENRNKLAKAEQEYQQQLERLITFESDGTHWSGTGQREIGRGSGRPQEQTPAGTIARQ